MSIRSNTKRNYMTDSNHLFFSPKLSLEGKNLLPQISDFNQPHHHEQNFLTVLKKPIVSLYDRIAHAHNSINGVSNLHAHSNSRAKKERRPVCVVGQQKEFQKRICTTNHKKRNTMTDYNGYQFTNEGEEMIMMRNYKETIHQTATQKKYSRRSEKKVYNPEKQIDNSEYYYYIGQGNNSELIESIMKRRMNWTLTSSTLFHFRWEQARPKYHNSQTAQKQLFNHLPNHEAISDKCSLVKHLKIFCEKIQEQVFQIIPACFQFNFRNLDLCEVEIKKFVQFFWELNDKNERMYMEIDSDENNKEVKKENVNINNNNGGKIGRNSSLIRRKKDSETTVDSPKKFTQSNKNNGKNFRTHKKEGVLVNTDSIRKREEVKQLHRTLLTKIKNHYLFQDMSNLKKQSSYLTPSLSDAYGSSSLWLLKPADLNRGRGIKLFRTIQELGDLLKSQLSRQQKSSFIIQKYIQKPMLIENRKFDIRIFAMVTHNRELFLFKQGYIRTSSTPFDLYSKNYFTHLTNNAIQKNSKQYGEFEEGNILELKYLFENSLLDEDKFNEDLRKLVRISMRSVFENGKMFAFDESLVNNGSLLSNVSSFNASSGQSKSKYFEIFGYDFMVDQTGHLWIIEVNTNPSIELSNQYLKQIIPRMLDDAFKLTIDRIFPRGREIKSGEEPHFPVRGHRNNENLWEYVELKQQTPELAEETDKL